MNDIKWFSFGAASMLSLVLLIVRHGGFGFDYGLLIILAPLLVFAFLVLGSTALVWLIDKFLPRTPPYPFPSPTIVYRHRKEPTE